jgi:hypothetical protein
MKGFSAKTSGILFLFVCLLIVLFIGQWMYLGKLPSPVVGGVVPTTEGFKEGAKPSNNETSPKKDKK